MENKTEKADVKKTSAFAYDPATHRLKIWKLEFRLPQSRLGRTLVGIGLILGGVFSFLPLLGVWMLPLGVYLLSHDFHVVRRLRRKAQLWWSKRRNPPSVVRK
jgi:hypothetical protein